MGQQRTEELIEELTPRQRALIEQVRTAKAVHDNAKPNYAAALIAANEAGISWGILGYELGEFRELLFRFAKHWSRKR